MTSPPPAVALIAQMSDVILGMKAREQMPRKLHREMMSLLEVRDLAREGQVIARRLRPDGEEQRDAWQKFRMAMTLLEIRVHEFLAGRPSSKEQEQRDMDAFFGVMNEVVLLPSVMLEIEDPGPMS